MYWSTLWPTRRAGGFSLYRRSWPILN